MCFRPNIVSQSIDRVSGQLVSVFKGSAYGVSPLQLTDPFSSDSWSMLVPCGHCLDCKISRSRDWVARMVFEFLDNDRKALFLTLTYDNDHLPWSDSGSPTLYVPHVQNFMKSLRKHFAPRRLRFYLCGEYGDRSLRPHYHAIIFGLSLSDFRDLSLRKVNANKDPFFSSVLLSRLWKHGFHLISDCSPRTFSYVARYTLKKHSFKVPRGSKPIFSICSRRPGIGVSFAERLIDRGLSSVSFFDGFELRDYHIPGSLIKLLRSRNQSDFLDNIYRNRVLTSLQKSRSDVQYFQELKENLAFSKQFYLEARLSILPERNEFDA